MYLKNITSGFLNQCMKIVSKFIVSIFVARTLGHDGYGEAAYFLLVFNFIAGFGRFGVCHGSSYFAKHDTLPVREQFSTNVTYTLINCVLFSVLLSVPPIREQILPGYSDRLILLGAGFLLAQYMVTLQTRYYIALDQVYISNNYALAGSVLAAAGILIAWMADGISIETYVLILVIESLFIAALMYRRLPYGYRPAFNVRFLFREWKYGNLLFWASLFGYLNYRVDQVMIRYQCGAGALALYSIAVSITELVFFIPDSFSNAVFGRVLNMQDDAPEKKQLVAMTVKACLYLSLGVSLLGVAAAPLIECFYGSGYAGSISCMRILLAGVSGAAVAKVIFPVFLAKGKVVTHLCVTFITFLFNVVMNCFLIPRWGIDGAAFASTLAYLFYGGSYILLLRRAEGISVRSLLLVSGRNIQMIRSLLHKTKHRIS